MKRLEEEKRRRARELYFKGWGAAQTAEAVGCSEMMIYKLLRQYPRKPGKRNALRLSLAEREEIAVGIGAGESFRCIARRLKRASSTISREVKAQGRQGYRAWRAEERAEKLLVRPKTRKLERHKPLRKAVEEGLSRNWSPGQISKRLRKEYAGNLQMQISPETIYQTLYVQGRGALRRELTAHLRRARMKRKSRTPTQVGGKIKDMVNISQRPAEVADRAVPGHWEGDLIIGKNNKSAIGTLVERKTGFVMLLHLTEGKTADCVRKALTKKIQKLPAELKGSLTWDQGAEMTDHLQFTIDTGVQVYFCDPHSPWQRGSNENTNGLLRQYFPKGEDLSVYSEAHLNHVAREMNGRPRQTLQWCTPSEKLYELMR